MSLYEVVKAQLDVVIAEAKVDMADNKVTLSEIWSLTTKTVGAFIVIAKEFDGDNSDKKLVVMSAAERLYDEVIAPLDIAAIPNFIEPAVDKVGRSVFLEIVSGVVDGAVAFLKKAKGE